MSANNQVIITKEKGKFEVHLNPCMDKDWWSSKKTLLKKFDSILHAIKFANEYCYENDIEYGTYVHTGCYEKTEVTSNGS